MKEEHLLQTMRTLTDEGNLVWLRAGMNKDENADYPIFFLKREDVDVEIALRYQTVHLTASIADHLRLEMAGHTEDHFALYASVRHSVDDRVRTELSDTLQTKEDGLWSTCPECRGGEHATIIFRDSAPNCSICSPPKEKPA